MAFAESFSGGEKITCSVINHSGSIIVLAKPASLTQLARGKAPQIPGCTNRDNGSKMVKINLGMGGKMEAIFNTFNQRKIETPLEPKSFSLALG